MGLAGQPFDFAHGKGNRGYAMAALLVGMSVMAVLMGALLPVWTHLAIREKEEELIFRGRQYARAIGLFQRKFANTPPPTVDVLVEQRFLRKKYKDPITNEDFQPIYANQAMQGVTAPTGAQQPGQQATAISSTPAQQTLQSGFGGTGVGAAGGIIGVTSKSKETSIKLYNGRDRYNEWAFVHVQTAQRPGQPGPGGAPAGGMPQGMPQGMPGGAQRPGQPGPFGMQPGSFPGQRPNEQQPPFPPGFGQPNRPPVGSPGGFGSPGGTVQPLVPGQRPPTGRPPGQ